MGRVLALLLVLIAFPVEARDAVWETGGFANPESVVWDGDRKVAYVSNVNGAAPDKDGNGFISTLSIDGTVLARQWAVGLDGPQGMAVRQGRLYVADIDRLVVFDTATGKAVETTPIPGAKLLADVAIDERGNVYISDTLGNAIWRLSNGRLEKWLSNPALAAPSGLEVDGGRLIVASWGTVQGDAKLPGGLKAVSLASRTIADLSPNLGTLSGVEPDGKGGFLVSDYVKGIVWQVSATGTARELLRLKEGSANIGVIVKRNLLLVPMMMDGKVAAYRLP